MNKTNILAILIAFIAESDACHAQFRNFDWGTSREEVLENDSDLYGNSYSAVRLNAWGFSGELIGIPFGCYYLFSHDMLLRGELTEGRYTFPPEPESGGDEEKQLISCISIFNKLYDGLSIKYGEKIRGSRNDAIFDEVRGVQSQMTLTPDFLTNHLSQTQKEFARSLFSNRIEESKHLWWPWASKFYESAWGVHWESPTTLIELGISKSQWRLGDLRGNVEEEREDEVKTQYNVYLIYKSQDSWERGRDWRSKADSIEYVTTKLKGL